MAFAEFEEKEYETAAVIELASAIGSRGGRDRPRTLRVAGVLAAWKP